MKIKKELSEKLLKLKIGKTIPEDTAHYAIGKLTKVAAVNYMLAGWYNTPETFIAVMCVNFMYGMMAFEAVECPRINDILNKHAKRTKEFNERMELQKIKNSVDKDIEQL